LMIMKPGSFTPGHSQSITVGEQGASGILVDVPNASITGVVVDGRGKGIAGAQVMIVPEDMGTFRSGDMEDAMRAVGGMTSCDGDGNFTVEGIAPGRYVARAWQQDFAGAFSRPFDVPEFGEGPKNIRVALSGGATVMVRVKLPSGKPIANGWIYVTDSAGMLVPVTMMQAAQTDTSGVVEVRLAPGTYRIEAQAPGYPAVSGQITVSGEETLEIELDVPDAASLTVVVTDSAGAPVKDAVVNVLDEQGRSVVRRMTGDFLQDAGDSTKTDATGRILYPLLSAGTYEVQVVDGARAGKQSVRLSAGETREITLIIR
jgi:protocatechuate 3,4-dioxygenase beta subunit